MKFFINSYFGDNHSIGLLSHIKKPCFLTGTGMSKINGWCSVNIRKEVGLSDNPISTDFVQVYAPALKLWAHLPYAEPGYDPFYFHMFSLLLHIGCVCLVWKLISSLLRVHGGVSEKQILYVNFITTLLFLQSIRLTWRLLPGSVRWKCCYMLFSISWGLLCYLRYIRTSKIFYYVLTIGCFLCSFWGKEQAVTFPLALLIADWFTNRNMKNLEVWVRKCRFSLWHSFGIITVLSERALWNDFPIISAFTFWMFCLSRIYY